MGTHPIFESDFDCLTEKMASDACTFNRINLDNELNNFQTVIVIGGVQSNLGNFLNYSQYRSECTTLGCSHCGQYPTSQQGVEDYTPPTTTVATTTTVSTTTVPTTRATEAITTASGSQPHINLALLFMLL